MRTRAKIRLWFLFSVLFTPVILRADGGLTFELNAGQTAAGIRYIARASNGIFFVTDSGIILNGVDQTVPAFELRGADVGSQWQPEAATGHTVSYFIGRDPSKWIEDLPRYERLIRHNVYPGIDLVLCGSEGQLEYDFELAPHADPSRIRLKLSGADRASIAPDETLVVETSAGELRHRKPILTEMLPDGSRHPIRGSFQITGPNEIGFAVENHDPALPLSIDPVLESSTYFGGHGDDQVIGTDGQGTLVGNTTSIDLPGAQFGPRNGTNLFVRTSTQTIIVGCSGNVTATSASFQPSGSIFAAVGGYTDCVDLPTNLGAVFGYLNVALQPEYGGGATDGFLFLAFSSNGSPAPSFSLTYIGGPGDDRVNAVNQTTYGYLAIAGSTSAGGLPEPSEFPCPVQTAPSGGLDAFLMLAYALAGNPPGIVCTEYIGGSGDDTALGVASYDNFVYVTGETQSPNFPLLKPLYSNRQGPSDAFIASFLEDGTLVASTLFGGSGSDQAVAATTMPNGNLVVAGITSSTDLPLKNPTQKAYGGGASDAFMAQFTPGLASLVSSTYIGGSDADEATSIASSYPNTVFVGGWTASHDFPTVNALQKSYGGGPDDGFLVHFDDDGSIYEATFFGGSGSDHVLGLSGSYAVQQSAAYGPTVWLTGTTTSPDLPLQNASQTNLAGPSDGFVAEITAELVTMPPFYGGKDLRGTVPMYFGDPQVAVDTTFTITSSDPSTVQVAPDTTTPGAASVEIEPFFNGLVGRFYADCLTSSGTAELTVTAPGFTTKKVPAQCLPSAIWVSLALGNPPPIQTYVGIPSDISFALGPENGNFIIGGSPRPGTTPPTVDISSSNPAIVTLSASSVTLSSSPQGMSFTPIAIGSTELTFSAGAIPILPSSTAEVNVGGSYSVGPVSVPAGFEGLLYLQVTQGGAAKIPTVTSGDPSRFVLSLDPLQPGTKSVTPSSIPIGSAPGIWIQAVGSGGTAPLTISVPGQPDVSTTVTITAPLIDLQYSPNTGQPLTLQVGGAATINAGIQSPTPQSAVQLRLNPSSSALKVTLNSSNSGVVSITPSTAEITPGTLASVAFQVVGAAAGSTVLTPTTSAKIGAGETFPSATVNVGTTGILFPPLDLGNNLAGQMTLTLPAPPNSDTGLTVSVSDPTLVLLSLDAGSPGLPQITTFVSGGQNRAQFYVYGLAASGQVTITATPAAIGPLTTTVNLHPSGFYWDAANLEPSFGTGPIFPLVDLGPIDTASGFPLGTQTLAPGVSGTLGVSNSNPKILTLSSSQLSIPLSQLSLEATPIAQGNTTLTIQQPNGFTAASVRQQLTIDVGAATPGLSITNGSLGKNTQSQLSILPPGHYPLTVTSSDPSKVLLSADPTKLGSRSVKVNGEPVYLQTLAGSGTVTISASSPNYASTSAVFTLVPTGFGIALEATTYPFTNQNGTLTTTTESGPVNVVVNLYLNPNQTAGTLLPSLGPFSLNVASSNTGAATITGTPVTTPAKQPYFGQGLAQATLLPVGPGETTISISQPPGFSSVGADTVALDVVAPALNLGNPLAIAKDCISPSGVSLPQGIPPLTASLPVTLTSSDPSRVLLSPDTTTAPAPSITVTIPVGQTGAGFYIQALADNGNVSINASASGFAASSASVQLFPLAFAFSTAPNSPIQAIIQSGPQNVQVTAAPLVPSNFNLGVAGQILRPGVPPIVVNITSSDPTIVSVSPGQIVFQGTLGTPSVAYTPKKPGTATIKLSAPNGYQVVPSQGQFTVIANESSFSFSIYPTGFGPEIGDNLQVPLSFNVQAGQSNIPVTITSSDPSSLVISTDGTVLGKGSINLPASQTGFPTIFLQSLAGSGNPTVSFQSPGYQTTILPVTLVRAAAIFQAQGTQDVLTNAGVIQQPIILVPLGPLSQNPGFLQSPGVAQSARPGANLSVQVTSSDPKVVAITTPSVQIPVQLTSSPPASVGIQPVSAGTAVVTLGPLAGNPIPPNGNELTFDVSAPSAVVVK